MLAGKPEAFPWEAAEPQDTEAGSGKPEACRTEGGKAAKITCILRSAAHFVRLNASICDRIQLRPACICVNLRQSSSLQADPSACNGGFSLLNQILCL